MAMTRLRISLEYRRSVLTRSSKLIVVMALALIVAGMATPIGSQKSARGREDFRRRRRGSSTLG